MATRYNLSALISDLTATRDAISASKGALVDHLFFDGSEDAALAANAAADAAIDTFTNTYGATPESWARTLGL